MTACAAPHNAPLTAAALAYSGAAAALAGAWAQFAPEGFYAHFPGLGVWVAGDGPYNEHLIRDVGGLNLSLAVLSLLALVAPRLVAARAVGLASLVYAVPHLVYHLFHLPTLSSATDQVLSLAALGVSAAVALFLASRPAVDRPEPAPSFESSL